MRSNKSVSNKARRMKRRGNCPPGVGVHGALAEGFERGRSPSRVTRVAERPGANNRQVGVAAGVSDQGQMSRLLARLEGLGLLENRGTRALGAPYAWHLTARGVESLRAGESAGSAR
jgi:hypothetical protein